MSDKKTTSSKSSDVSEERDFNFPELGVTVKATNIEEAEKLARAQVKDESDKSQEEEA